MTRLTPLSHREVVRALTALGFATHRQGANHLVMIRRDPTVTIITVPRHSTIATGTIAAIARQAGVTPGQFLRLARS